MYTLTKGVNLPYINKTTSNGTMTSVNCLVSKTGGVQTAVLQSAVNSGVNGNKMVLWKTYSNKQCVWG